MILLYHLIFSDDTPKNTWNAGGIIRLSQLLRQLKWLSSYRQLVSLEEYLAEPEAQHERAAITFDDGYKKTFEMIEPHFEREKIPATIFANTSHLEDGKLLWFVYINALCSESVFSHLSINGMNYPLTSKRARGMTWRELIHQARRTGNPIHFTEELASRYPLPASVISQYIGLSRDQIQKIGHSQYFSLGGHTHSHPYLDQLGYETQLQQVITNKDLLETISGQQVKYFAYTGGLYSEISIQVVKQAGFLAALAVNPLNIYTDRAFEIPRVDIYSPSVLKLLLKNSRILKLINRARTMTGLNHG